MRFLVLGLLCMLLPFASVAQRQEKPRLLVYGSDMVAFSAAIQAARSNVPTIWVFDQPELLDELGHTPLDIHGGTALDGGLWMELLMKVSGEAKQRSDSVAMAMKKDLNPQIIRNIAEEIIASSPQLQVERNQSIRKVDQSRRRWRVSLSNGVKVQAYALIDASSSKDLLRLAEKENLLDSAQEFGLLRNLSLQHSRTSLAQGEIAGDIRVVLLGDLLASQSDNVFDVGKLSDYASDTQSLPFRAAAGQALGGLAGYCAFFKTSSDKINIRMLQAELLAFKQRIMPYQDIRTEDPNFSSLQKLYLTGIFPGEFNQEGRYCLFPDRPVEFSEVKEFLLTVHSRSQLWFLDHPHDGVMSWGDLMDFTKFVSFKGDEIIEQVKRDWQRKFKFDGEYDPQAPVTRAQFAVVTDLFSDVFAKAVNLDGSFVR